MNSTRKFYSIKQLFCQWNNGNKQQEQHKRNKEQPQAESRSNYGECGFVSPIFVVRTCNDAGHFNLDA